MDECGGPWRCAFDPYRCVLERPGLQRVAWNERAVWRGCRRIRDRWPLGNAAWMCYWGSLPDRNGIGDPERRMDRSRINHRRGNPDPGEDSSRSWIAMDGIARPISPQIG